MDLSLTVTEMNITDEVGSEPLLLLDFAVVPGFQRPYKHTDDWQDFFLPLSSSYLLIKL